MPLVEGIIIVTDEETIEEFLDQFISLDYTDEKYDRYWCINIKPFKCANCGDPICYAQCGSHFIIIWEEKDDENLLNIAAELQRADMDPRVVNYNRYLGPCVVFEDAVEHGWINFGSE